MARDILEKELKKGQKVFILSNANPGSLHKINILGTIEEYPEHWTRVKVKFFDPDAGPENEKGLPQGDWVVQKFASTHLAIASADECEWFARKYQKTAIEFRDHCLELKGKTPPAK